MIRLAVVLALIGLSAAAPEPKVALAKDIRVVNGEPAAPGQYPFQVSLQVRNSHNCGGTILDANWMLTAAHCLFGWSPSQLQVRSGTNTWASGGTIHNVASLTYHEGYVNSAYWPNDVGVAQVTPPFPIDGQTVAPTNLAAAGSDEAHGTPSEVCGWGSKQYGGSVQPDLLRADLTIVGDAECLAAYGEGPIESQICSGGGGTGICSGDSGGPLIVGGRQVGITSWTRIPCAQIAAVWTQVSYFRDWICTNSGVC